MSLREILASENLKAGFDPEDSLDQIGQLIDSVDRWRTTTGFKSGEREINNLQRALSDTFSWLDVAKRNLSR